MRSERPDQRHCENMPASTVMLHPCWRHVPASRRCCCRYARNATFVHNCARVCVHSNKDFHGPHICLKRREALFTLAFSVLTASSTLLLTRRRRTRGTTCHCRITPSVRPSWFACYRALTPFTPAAPDDEIQVQRPLDSLRDGDVIIRP